jgi:peptide/nickel transport system substrate-binding protein
MRRSHSSTVLRALALTLAFALLATACSSDDAETTSDADTTSDTDDTTSDTDDTTNEADDTTNEADDTTDEADDTTDEADDTSETTRLVFAVPPPDQGESNNPNRDLQPNDEYQLKPMYENLVGVDPETSAWVGMLAETWELNDAGDQLTFNLRQGVEFHNGMGEMTADDVVFSFMDLIEPAGAVSGVAESVRNAVTEFEIVDDYTVIFHVGEDLSFAFFEGISYGAAGTVIKSKADWETRGSGSTTPTFDEMPLAGTGSYQFLERTSGENVVFEKVPYDHWRKNGEFQEIEYRYVSENSTRLAGMLAGEFALTSLPLELGDEAESQGMSVIKSALPGRRYGMSFLGCYYAEAPEPGELSADVFVSGDRKYPDSPWCNRDVRIAANKSIDRSALNDAFFAGEAAEDSRLWYWVPEQTDSWNPDWETNWQDLYGYDPDGAKASLAAAGFEPGEVEIEIFDAGDITQAIAVMLEDGGFNVSLLSMDKGQFSSLRENRELDNAMEFDDTASENVTGFEPQGYANQDSGRAIEDVAQDTLYEAVIRELDPAAQAVLWKDFGDVIFDNVQHIPMFRTFSEYVADPAIVCGYTFPGANMSAPYSFVEYIDAC